MTKIKEATSKFLNSYYYILLFALLMFLSWFFEIKYIAIASIALFSTLVFLTQKNIDNFMPILILFILFFHKNSFKNFGTSDYIIFAILSAFVIASFVYFIIKNKHNFKRDLKNSKLLIGMIIALIAVRLGGIIYESYTITFAYRAIWPAVAFMLVYILFYKCATENLKFTLARSLIAFSLVIIAQLIVFFVTSNDFVGIFYYKALDLGWANSSGIAYMLTFTLPFAFYLSMKCKHGWIYHLLTPVIYICILLTGCRSMLIASTFIFPCCVIYSILKAKNIQYQIAQICYYIFVVCIGTILILMFSNILLGFVSTVGFDDNGRTEIWLWGLDEFKQNLLFGIGFFTDSISSHPYMGDVGRALYLHCTPLQILTCTGLVGGFLFVPYYYTRLKLLLTKPTTYKIYMIIGFISVLIYNLVDSYFLRFYKVMFFMFMLITLELESEQDKTENWKPNRILKLNTFKKKH